MESMRWIDEGTETSERRVRREKTGRVTRGWYWKKFSEGSGRPTQRKMPGLSVGVGVGVGGGLRKWSRIEKRLDDGRDDVGGDLTERRRGTVPGSTISERRLLSWSVSLLRDCL